MRKQQWRIAKGGAVACARKRLTVKVAGAGAAISGTIIVSTGPAARNGGTCDKSGMSSDCWPQWLCSWSRVGCALSMLEQ